MPDDARTWRDNPDLDAKRARWRAEEQVHRPNGAAEPTLRIDDEAWTEADIPRRPWVAPGFALRGTVTVVAGPPSALKSSLMLAWACAVALGRPHGQFRPAETGRVVIYNVEDDSHEQRRRLSAVLRQFDAAPADIAGKVIRVSPGGGIGVLFAHNREMGGVSSTPAMDQLRELIADRQPAMLIVDPFAELHTAEENDNTALRAIIAEFRTLAAEFDIAVIIIHHTRKGLVTPGDPDAVRGASSIVGAGRIVLTLVTMSEDDAKTLGLGTDRKSRATYVRLDDARQNYAGIGDARWYEKVVYALGNGEHVPAAVPWSPPETWAGLSHAVLNAVLTEIDDGMPNGQRYSGASAATDRAVWPVVQKHCASKTESQCRQIIATWVRNGVLFTENYADPVERKPRKGLQINPAKRPS